MNQTANWSSLIKNHILRRDWETLRSVWSAAALGYDAAQSSDLSAALAPIVGPNFEERDNVTVFSFVGGSVAAFSDAIAALLKCAYVFRAVGSCLISGQPTWASIDAYHFSLIAGRALLAFMGVHFVQVRDTHCLLDLFPSGIGKDRDKFRRLNPGISDAAKLTFQKRSQVIGHQAVWSALVRVFRVSGLPPSIGNDVDKIVELGEGFAKARNAWLYSNSAWLYDEDRAEPSCHANINDNVHSYLDLDGFFESERDANFAFAATLARILAHLVEDVENQSGVELLTDSYSPCLVRFQGFGFSTLDALYATLYRKENYGMNI